MLVKADYWILFIKIITYGFHTLKIEEIQKQAPQLREAKLDKKELNFENIFRANPPIDSGYHFGSRLAIRDNYLFASAGERGQGMIAQDPTKHPGSIIRIHADGSIPRDNPKFEGKTKLVA